MPVHPLLKMVRPGRVHPFELREGGPSTLALALQRGRWEKLVTQTFSLLIILAYAATSASWAGPIGIGSSTQALAYGSLVAGSGGNVIISSLGRSASGGVVLLPSGSWSAASFNVTGDPGVTYAATLPGNGVVFLTSGSNTMAVNNFTSNPALTSQLSAGGSQTLTVGATLTVGGNQASGGYSGSFNVIVDYN